MARALLLREIIMKTKQKKLGGLGLAALLFVALPRMLYAYEEIVVKDGVTIRGTVKVEGKLPKLPPLQISKYKEVCKDVPNENLIVGHGNGLRYAVVTLEGIAKGKAVEKEAIHELDNVKCRFVPHVQTASVGQFVLIKNTDPILHTAHAYFASGQPHFNVGTLSGTGEPQALDHCRHRQDPLRSPSLDDRVYRSDRTSLSFDHRCLWRIRTQ